MPRGELEALQLERLQGIVQTAWDKVGYYRAKMEAAGVAPTDIRSLADVAKLPFTTKDDLRGCFPYQAFAVPMEEVVRIHASSGTTGQATVVGYTKQDLDTWSELMARLHTAAGMTNRDIVQIAFGYGFFTGGIGHHYGVEKMGAAVLPISSGKSERQIQIMKDYGSTVLICTPSYGMYLAELIQKTGVAPDLRLRLGLFGGEAWTDEMRRALEKGLGVFATDNYGLSEVMGPGVSCECVEQHGMHIAEDHFLPELIEVRGFAHAVNVGADRLRFLAPVPVGSRIRAAGEIVKVEEIRGAVQTTVRVTIEIEGCDKPACTIDTISRYYPDEGSTA